MDHSAGLGRCVLYYKLNQNAKSRSGHEMHFGIGKVLGLSPKSIVQKCAPIYKKKITRLKRLLVQCCQYSGKFNFITTTCYVLNDH